MQAKRSNLKACRENEAIIDMIEVKEAGWSPSHMIKVTVK